MSTKRKLPVKLTQPIVKQSPKPANRSKLDETRAVVTGVSNLPAGKTIETVEISSDSSSDDEVSSEEEEEEKVNGDQSKSLVSTAKTNGDVDMKDAEEDEEEGEPSFGDLVRANASEPIDVAAFDEGNAGALDYPQALQLNTSGASLGTVLSQALKTNDVDLLESCLQVSELEMIQSTIQRLPSPLAGTLLHKLAERLHRRPGRAGSLLIWVQWTLVTHGGYLATQPDLMQRLIELNRVVDERARSLQSLLSLKGKLDMLEAQMRLRRNLQGLGRGAEEYEEDEEDVIYVEGEESDEEADGKILDRRGEYVDVSDEDEDLDINGHLEDSDEDSEDDSDEGGLIDDEAEETDDDSGEEDEVDHDDHDSEDEESDEAADLAPPPSKKRR